MKKIFLIGSVLVGMLSCADSDKKGVNGTAKDSADLKGPSIQWIDSTTKDLGQLNKDQTIEISYRFKNTGDKPLVIENVSAPCGCTIPEKPEQPIAPGEEGLIKARFNGSGYGTISKIINVKANTNPTDHTLTFRGQIQEK